jgi:hypothetical protein
VTFASDESDPGLLALRNTAALAGLELTVVGLGLPYDNYQDKLTGYRNHLRALLQASDETAPLEAGSDDSKGRIYPHDLVLLVDAYDVLLFPALRRLPEVLARSATPVLFCAEDGIYPEFASPWLYARGAQPAPPAPIDEDGPSPGRERERERGSGTLRDDDDHEYDPDREHQKQRFLNSGCITGRAEQVLEMLDVVFEDVQTFRDDQQCFVRYVQGNPHRAGVLRGSPISRPGLWNDASSARAVTKRGSGQHSSGNKADSNTNDSDSSHASRFSPVIPGGYARQDLGALMVTGYRLQAGTSLHLSAHFAFSIAPFLSSTTFGPHGFKSGLFVEGLYNGLHYNTHGNSGNESTHDHYHDGSPDTHGLLKTAAEAEVALLLAGAMEVGLLHCNNKKSSSMYDQVRISLGRIVGAYYRDVDGSALLRAAQLIAEAPWRGSGREAAVYRLGLQSLLADSRLTAQLESHSSRALRDRFLLLLETEQERSGGSGASVPSV